MDYNLLIIICSYLIFLLLTWVLLNYKNNTANNSVIITMGLSLLDVITDILSAIELYNLKSDLYVYSIIFIVLPVLINQLIGWIFIYFLIKKNPAIELPRSTSYGGRIMVVRHPSLRNTFSDEPPEILTTRSWLSDNYILCTIIVMFSMLNVENLTFLSSKLGDGKTLKIIWPENYEHRIRICGMISNILEDIPQTCLQIYFMIISQNISLVLVLAVVIGILSLFFSLSKRILLYLLMQRNSDENTDKIDS